jgi:hypothetical protein
MGFTGRGWPATNRQGAIRAAEMCRLENGNMGVPAPNGKPVVSNIVT